MRGRRIAWIFPILLACIGPSNLLAQAVGNCNCWSIDADGPTVQFAQFPTCNLESDASGNLVCGVDDTGATLCSGTFTYLDGEGNCDSYTFSGNTTQLATVFGAIGSSTNCVAWDGSGNLISSGGPCGTGDVTSVGNCLTGDCFGNNSGTVLTIGVSGASTDQTTMTASDSPSGKPRLLLDAVGTITGRIIARDQIMVGSTVDGDETSLNVEQVGVYVEGGVGTTVALPVNGLNILATSNVEAGLGIIGDASSVIYFKSTNDTSGGGCSGFETPKVCCSGAGAGSCVTGLVYSHSAETFKLFVDSVAVVTIWP